MQNLVTLPDANALPDGKTLVIGIQRLTLAEQDCRFRMNDDHPETIVWTLRFLEFHCVDISNVLTI